MNLTEELDEDLTKAGTGLSFDQKLILQILRELRQITIRLEKMHMTIDGFRSDQYGR